jgi:hypothetical protein
MQETSPHIDDVGLVPGKPPNRHRSVTRAGLQTGYRSGLAPQSRHAVQKRNWRVVATDFTPIGRGGHGERG